MHRSRYVVLIIYKTYFSSYSFNVKTFTEYQIIVYSKILGADITTCPLTHPYAFKQGRNCCKTKKEDSHPNSDYSCAPGSSLFYHPHCDSTCDGSELSLYSNCCEDGAFLRCPDGKLCDDGNVEGGIWRHYSFVPNLYISKISVRVTINDYYILYTKAIQLVVKMKTTTKVVVLQVINAELDKAVVPVTTSVEKMQI